VGGGLLCCTTNHIPQHEKSLSCVCFLECICFWHVLCHIYFHYFYLYNYYNYYLDTLCIECWGLLHHQPYSQHEKSLSCVVFWSVFVSGMFYVTYIFTASTCTTTIIITSTLCALNASWASSFHIKPRFNNNFLTLQTSFKEGTGSERRSKDRVTLRIALLSLIRFRSMPSFASFSQTQTLFLMDEWGGGAISLDAWNFHSLKTVSSSSFFWTMAKYPFLSYVGVFIRG